MFHQKGARTIDFEWKQSQRKKHNPMQPKWMERKEWKHVMALKLEKWSEKNTKKWSHNDLKGENKNCW